jgi:hypothetical protein
MYRDIAYIGAAKEEMELTSYPRPVRLVQYTIKGQYWKLHHHAIQQVQNHSHL